MSTRTTTTPATNAATPPAKPAQISVARQVRQQRRGYAPAALRTLATDIAAGRPVELP